MRFLLVEQVKGALVFTPQGPMITSEFWPVKAWPSYEDCEMARGIMERLGDGVFVCVQMGTLGI